MVCYIQSKFSDFSNDSNTNVPQDGAGMYLRSCFTFIFQKLNSLPLYVKGYCIIIIAMWVVANKYAASKSNENEQTATVFINFGTPVECWYSVINDS